MVSLATTPPLLGFIDEFVGPVVGTNRFVNSRLMPRMHNASVAAVGSDAFHVDFVSEDGEGVVGGASDHSLLGADLAAVGEALERYCSCYLDPERVKSAVASDLDERYLPVWEYPLFTEQQYQDFADRGEGYAAPDPDRVYNWVRGVNILNDDVVWAPAQCVFLGPCLADDEPNLGPQVSTGIAFGPDAPWAAVRGLLENIERDAFMQTWDLRVSLPVLDVATAKTGAALAAALAGTTTQIVVLDATQFLGVPTAITMAYDAPGSIHRVGIAVGAASALLIDEAVDKSAREALQTHVWAKGLMRKSVGLDLQPSEISTLEDHVAFHANPTNLAYSNFLRQGAAEPQPLDRSNDLVESGQARDHSLGLRRLIEHLDRRGVEVLAFDLTAPDIEAAGFVALRVLTPGLCLLDIEANARFFGQPRLIAQALRYGVESFNPVPHPFP